jgi:hypothetical protein
MNSQQEMFGADGAAGSAAWGRDPVDSLELRQANPYEVALFSLRGFCAYLYVMASLTLPPRHHVVGVIKRTRLASHFSFFGIGNVQEQLVKGVKLNQQLSNASLPRHRNLLQQQYGAMAGAVLAEAVSGRPWGLPKVLACFVFCFIFVGACCW